MPENTPQPFAGPERRRARPAEVRLTDQTIDYLEEKMKAAVADGIKSAMTEETAKAFWSAGLAVLQKQATAHTGRFVVGGLWGAGHRAWKVSGAGWGCVCSGWLVRAGHAFQDDLSWSALI